MFIYKITNKINGKLYIGQTKNPIQRRFTVHMWHSKQYSDIKFYRAIAKYGKENFKIELIEECLSLEQMNEKEVYWISHYNSCKNGYNSNSGGNNASPSIEVRQKMSIKMKGRVLTDQHKANISKGKMGISVNKGKPLHPNFILASKNRIRSPNSDDQKKKISEKLKAKRKGDLNPFYGKKHTEETRAKISLANNSRYKETQLLYPSIIEMMKLGVTKRADIAKELNVPINLIYAVMAKLKKGKINPIYGLGGN